MGLFDTIYANGKTYQTKAFGKNLNRYTIGDTVYLVQAAFTEEEYKLWGFEGKQQLPLQAYQVECLGDDAGGYMWITVTEGRITAVGARTHNLPAFDYHGRRMEDDEEDVNL